MRRASLHAMLKLYGFSRVNEVARGNTRDLRILWALEEMQLAYELVGLDHPAHELDTEAYRALSPFGQIPAIRDGDVVLSESAAILFYLARKTGLMMPRDAAGEAQVVRWSFAAMNTVEFSLLSIALLDFNPEDRDNPYRARMVELASRHLTSLERWLEGRSFIATDDFTIADILMAHVMPDDELLAPYSNARAYRDRCKARPAWQRTIARYCARVEAAS